MHCVLSSSFFLFLLAFLIFDLDLGKFSTFFYFLISYFKIDEIKRSEKCIIQNNLSIFLINIEKKSKLNRYSYY